MKVKKPLKILDEFAPFDMAEDYDNVGLLVGSKEDTVNGIVVCLDCTLGAVEFAKNQGANVIVAHHPLIFKGINNIFTDEPKGAIIKKLLVNNINLIAAHTNVDIAEKGTGYAIACQLGLIDIYSSQDEPYLKIAQLEDAVDANQLNDLVSDKLNCKSRLYGDKQKSIKTVAIAPGSADESYLTAINHQADAFICGEAKHHNILDACARGLAFIETGHYFNEYPIVPYLSEKLTDNIDSIPITIYNDYPFTA